MATLAQISRSGRIGALLVTHGVVGMRYADRLNLTRMNSSSTRPIRARCLLLLAAAACTWMASCGGAGEEVELARKYLRRGELDKAEQALARGEGSAVERLVDEVQRARQEREAFLNEVAAALAIQSSSASSRALAELAGDAPDRACEERLDRARSRAADREAAELGGQPLPISVRDEREWEPEELIVEHDQGAVVARSEAQRAQVDLALASAAEFRERRQWEMALLELEMSLPSAGGRAGEVRALAVEIEREALADQDEILARVRAVEDSEGTSSARSYLLKHTGRFPGAGPLSEIHDELTRVTRAIGRRRQLERGAVELVIHQPSNSDQELAHAKAAALEAAGELAQAVDAWIDAGFSLGPGDGRDSLVGRARAIERRLLFRGEVAAAFSLDAGTFSEGGFTQVDAAGVTQVSGRVDWSELSGDDLRSLGRSARLSEQAEGGLLLERLATGSDGRALADLGRWVERGHMNSAEAWSLVAASLGEEIPEGGYVYDEGRWQAKAQFDAERLATNLDKYKRELLVATVAQREGALASLLDLGEEATPVATEVLLARWDRAQRVVRRGGVLESLKAVADQRRALDDARRTALELIFDTEEYFYPYNSPECPPDKARLYPPVQRRVDELVSAVREVWNGEREVRLPGKLLTGLDDLLWLKEVARDELELSLELGSEVPVWIWGIDPELKSVNLSTFAWDADESYDLGVNRDVVAYNEHLWASFRPKGRVTEGSGRRADVAEAEQVRVTNAYRLMMGRRAVVWNPQVQAAASMHSKYMADTGDFGHFERGDPQRRAPGDRMKLCGYASGASENCYAGSAAPRSAHNGWLHSSGHHRNILAPGHREMASGVIGNYWTQNFGRGTGYLNDLRTWRD